MSVARLASVSASTSTRTSIFSTLKVMRRRRVMGSPNSASNPSFGRGGFQTRPTMLRLLVLDRVGERAHALDLDLADVPVLHPDRGLAREADAGRRPRDDEVAGLERHRLG